MKHQWTLLQVLRIEMETHEVFNIFSGLGPSLVSNQHGHLSQIGMSMVAEGDASL